MLYGKLVKFLIPAVFGTALVCTTMLLTNTAGNLLNSIDKLNLSEKPKIDEEELQPKEEPPEEQPTSQTNSGENSQEESSSQSSQQSSQEDSTQSQETESSASAVATEGNTDLDEVIKWCAQLISERSYYWTADYESRQLTNIHSLFTTTAKFLQALKQKESQSNTPSAQ